MKPEEQVWDIVVCGAGIQGAGVAQAAAAEGWSALLLEKAGSPAQGTSCKSSKLIHGGLRYLETLQIKLVRECLEEKALLCTLAPSLVKPARFIVPVYQEWRRGPFWIHLGLRLYGLLGWPGLNPVRGKYPQSAWSEHAMLKTEGLQAIFEYQDAQTDDAALTEAVVGSAISLGAQAEYGVEIASVTRSEGHFVVALKNGRQIFSRTLVNATGPWVAEFSKLFGNVKVPELAVELVQGSHIVLDRPALECCYYLESPDDGRAMFVLPWKGQIMVGTTELLYRGKPEDCYATEAEIEYMLRAFNFYFPDYSSTRKDISQAFAGLRVLPHSDTPENKRSRDTLFVDSAGLPGYLGIYGGKLTAYRMSAEKIVRKLRHFIPQRNKIADTKKLILPSSPN